MLKTISNKVSLVQNIGNEYRTAAKRIELQITNSHTEFAVNETMIILFVTELIGDTEEKTELDFFGPKQLFQFAEVINQMVEEVKASGVEFHK